MAFRGISIQRLVAKTLDLTASRSLSSNFTRKSLAATQFFITKRSIMTSKRVCSGKDVDESRSTTSSAGGGPLAYESNKAVNEYLQYHFGKADDIMPYPIGPKEALRFPIKCAEVCQQHAQEKKRALDIGCAVGGSSFALTKWFDEVVGIDFSQSFIDAANAVKGATQIAYQMQVEGEIVQTCYGEVCEGARMERASFMQGDACNIPQEVGQFDAVLAANLLCRLPDPRAFLDRLPSLVKPGGVVVFFSPYSWLPGWTNPDKWLGGTVNMDGSPLYSFTTITDILSPNFELVEQDDTGFVIREHARKFQFGVTHQSVWRRK